MSRKSARRLQKFLFASFCMLFCGLVIWTVHSYRQADRFDAIVFRGEGKKYYPDQFRDGVIWGQFVSKYRLSPLERYFFRKMVISRMRNNPSKQIIKSFLTWTAMWQIYGEWNGNDEGGGVDFGRCEEAKPLLRKFLTEINEEEFRTRHRQPYHWYEGPDGIIYVSHLSTEP